MNKKKFTYFESSGIYLINYISYFIKYIKPSYLKNVLGKY